MAERIGSSSNFWLSRPARPPPEKWHALLREGSDAAVGLTCDAGPAWRFLVGLTSNAGSMAVLLIVQPARRRQDMHVRLGFRPGPRKSGRIRVDEVGHPNLSSPRAQPQLNKGSTSSDRWLTGGGNSLSAGSELPALYDSVVIRLSTPGLLAESA
ncbi:hypothetical protein PGT21_018312 [Puccinia graminis f. sp. tritici]|uniref:Uncharacterized protein n=1 Tax=Puccinia graminis f. sp. tritici TaxID=56615 RepID=A0A5B0MHW7_PUCGR|nr:hypothetical protein PGT21_018312 [Puccinia graminis f. sp. tritici]